MTRKYFKYLSIKCILPFLCLVISLCGCLIRPDVDPKPIPEPPNTFAPGSFFLREKVYKVEVYDSHERKSRLIWRVQSKEGVQAKGFKVTVGSVPDGFVQTIPPEGQMVYLIKGQKYRIQIWPHEWPGGVDPSGTAWVAK